MAWLARNTTSPATGAPLPSLDLKPNRAVKALADLLRSQHAADGDAGAHEKCHLMPQR